MLIGIMGLSGAGKTTFSDYLRELGMYIIDSDKVGREIVEKDSPVLKEIERVFGSRVILPDGTLDRGRLAGIVFESRDELEKLNAITKPEITRRIYHIINSQNTDIIGIDCAILAETEFLDKCAEVVFIEADRDKLIERIMKRDNISIAHAKARLSSQLENRKYATYIIENTAGLDTLKVRAKEFYNKILKESR